MTLQLRLRQNHKSQSLLSSVLHRIGILPARTTATKILLSNRTLKNVFAVNRPLKRMAAVSRAQGAVKLQSQKRNVRAVLLSSLLRRSSQRRLRFCSVTLSSKGWRLLELN